MKIFNSQVFQALTVVSVRSWLVTAQDDLGVGNDYVNLNTKHFFTRIVRTSQTLASLRPAGKSFDYLPTDNITRRLKNGQHHLGDVALRYREVNSATWIDVDSAAARKRVANLSTGALSASNLAPTLPASLPLNITREWITIDQDFGLRFTLTNTGNKPVEIGSLGFPMGFNNIFTGRSAEQIQNKCSLTDPYIGMHGGYIRVTPVSGTGPVLLVTPLPGTDTPFEAWRNLPETAYTDGYGSQTFEGFYEWQVLTKAWAAKEWASVDPWNPPTSRVLQPGQSLKVGFRFSLAKGGVRDIDNTLLSLGIPVITSIPGYVIPANTPSHLSIRLPPTNLSILTITSSPPFTLQITPQLHSPTLNIYQINPHPSTFGRARITITLSTNQTLTIHYYITSPPSQSVSLLGQFLTTKQHYTNTSDPFHRAPSILSYDYSTESLVLQDPRVWIAGLSDESGAGSFLAAAMKQAFMPNPIEVTKLEEFIDKVLWGRLQNQTDFSVKKSLFFYEPSDSSVKGYDYDEAINWSTWWSWNRNSSYSTDRAYNYVHVTATYWAFYRVARGYPHLLTIADRKWEWYLGQAYETVMRCVGGEGTEYSREGLMGETVFGEILGDLKREGTGIVGGASGWGDKAGRFEEEMRRRAVGWEGRRVPFGSEMAWDSTGQEGVYYWAKYFGFNATSTKTLNTVLGYDPTVPHWGWNGNARRYWDNIYGGKLQRIERQIHHYGSGLNALVLLSAFRSSTDPKDIYLLRAGYGGLTGAMSNINEEGFASASFHSWPDTLKWDGYSGDYGPNFVGLALGSATYLVEDVDGDFGGGLVAYGGSQPVLVDGAVMVETQDAFRRRVFVGPLKLLITIDAGVILRFGYRASDSSVSLTLSQLEDGPVARSAVVWLEATVGAAKFVVSEPKGRVETRGGWEISLDGNDSVTVVVGRA